MHFQRLHALCVSSSLYPQVQDWLSFRNTELHGLSEAQLLKVCLPATVWEFCVQVAVMLLTLFFALGGPAAAMQSVPCGSFSQSGRPGSVCNPIQSTGKAYGL